jgi:hypothetical protein
MNHQLSPSVQALQAELGRAIRRDEQRRGHRRKTLRTGALSVAGVAVLSGGALAAAGDLPVSEIQLPRDVSVEAVKSYPEFVGAASSSGFVTSGGGSNGSYIYHVTGGSAPELGCGPTDPHPTNNVYITSTRPLSEAEIEGMLKPDGEERTEGSRPPGVTSTSDGCPNPGLAGQPGTSGQPAQRGKAAVTVEPSNRTPAILPSTTPAAGNTPAQTPPAKTPAETPPSSAPAGAPTTSTPPTATPPTATPTTPTTTSATPTTTSTGAP